ncbi:MAG: carboxypeptidase-like regulatory domain-containing protein [Cryomorphaceae bacterium]
MKWTLILALCVCSCFLLAQDRNANLLIGGRIQDATGSSLKNASVKVTNEQGASFSVQANNDGSFEFTVPFDMVCQASFYAKKHQPKSIELDTRNVPKAEREWGYEFSGFIVNLTATTLPKLPEIVGRIYYDVSDESFKSVKK